MKIAIVGVGLIGGSIAAAIKHKQPDTSIVGIGRSQANLEIALQRNLIDDCCTIQTMPSVDLTVVSTPPQAALRVIEQLRPHDCGFITDATSYKTSICRLADHPKWKGSFVPSHPIAGTEHQGASAAQADLFENQRVILCPVQSNTPEALAQIQTFWETTGAVVSQMKPEDHDERYAWVSHGPHAYLYAFAAALFRQYSAAELAESSGGGLRDLIRVTASTPEMWQGIFAGNKSALLPMLREVSASLNNIIDSIESDEDLTELLASIQRNTKKFRENS